MSDDTGATGQAGPVVPLGAPEYLGPAGEVLPDVLDTPRPRRKRRAIVAGVVAAAVVAGGLGVLGYLRATPQWQVLSAARATMDSSGLARLTMSGTGDDAEDYAYEVSWSKDPGAIGFAVVENGGEGRTWVQVVMADERFYVRAEVWSRDMLQPSMGVPEQLLDLPAGAFGDAVEAGQWVELSSPGEVRELAGSGLGMVDDPEVRAQFERLRAIAEDGVRGHTSVTSDGSDERGDRYRVEVDLEAAVLAHADELEDVLTDLADRWTDQLRAQFGGSGVEFESQDTDIDVRAEAAKLRPLPFTLWLRDGRVAALRLAPHDLDKSSPKSAVLDVEFRELPAPLVPTDAVVVTSEQLQDLADSAFGLGGMSGLDDMPRLRDDRGRIWIKVDKNFAMLEESGGAGGIAEKKHGVWRDLDGNVIMLTPID